MFPILNIGPLAVHAPGLILVVTAWLALILVEREAKKRGDRSENLSGLAMTALIAGLVGARLWYAARFWESYLANPLGLLALNTSAFDLTGGMVIGAVAAILDGRRRGLRLRPTLDRLAPGLALGAIGLGLAHLASGDAFGAPTILPWAIDLWGAARHPSQIYEMIAAALIFGVIWRWRTQLPFSGFLFLAFITLSAAARLLLEAFRGDSILVAGGIRQGQLGALLVLLGALWLMRRWGVTPSQAARS